jgi:spermidine synthase
VRWTLPIIALCVTLSGTAGLIYEVVWSRYLGLIIGSSTVSHTVVLATFMGGLALGNVVFGRFADRTPRPLWAYGMIELGIAAWAAGLVFFWPSLVRVYLVIGQGLGPVSSWLLAVKIGLGLVVMLPPTMLMGGTLPLLSRFVVTGSSQIGPRIALLYFLNTAGAAVGCALAGFWLVEGLGLSGTLWVACGLNLLIGVATLSLANAAREPAPEATSPDQSEAVSARVRTVVLICVGVTGGLTMVYELVWIRMVGFIFGSSSQSFSVMLVTFLAGIALGGLIAGRILKRRGANLVAVFGVCEVGVALSVLAILPVYERFPYVFAHARTLFAPTDGGYTAMLLVQVALLGVVMIVPTTLMGVTLPIAARISVRSVQDVGSGVGLAFASNTAGTLIGAASAGLLLIPLVGVQGSLLGAVMMSAACGGALLWTAGSPRAGAACVGVCGVILAVIVLSGGAWNPVLMTAGYFRGKKVPDSMAAMRRRFDGHEILFARDGHDATVTVVRVDGAVFLKVNGKTDASTLREDMVTQELSARLPILLHPREPKDILVIGLGSGVTAGAALEHPGTTVVSVELSQAVVDGAVHFSKENRGVLQNPRHTLHVGDAKDYVQLTQERFDVVINEPSNPWISGVASLFTVEHFRAVRSVLNDGGVYVQWLQLYAFSDEAFSRSVRSLRKVFPHVTAWRFTRADCLLVASLAPLDVSRLEERLAAVSGSFSADSPLPLGRPADLLVHQVLSEEAVTASFGPVPPFNLDGRPFLEFEAPRAMFRKASPAILDDLDERRDPGAAGRLLYAQVAPAPPVQIADALSRSGHGALAEHLRTAGALDAAPTAERMIEAHGSGDSVPLLVRAMEGAETPSAPQCRAWAGRYAALAIHSRNGLYRPSLSILRRFVDRCVAAHPALSPVLLNYVRKAAIATGLHPP